MRRRGKRGNEGKRANRGIHTKAVTLHRALKTDSRCFPTAKYEHKSGISIHFM